jgi:hypothetical protein
MHKEGFSTNIKCITRTMHGFIGRLHPKKKRSGLRSTSWSTALMGEKGASVRTTEWSMLIEKISVQSRDRPVPGMRAHFDSTLQSYLLSSPSDAIGAKRLILLLSLSGSTTNPMAPGFSPPSAKSGGLLLGTTKLGHSLKEMSSDGNNIIYAYGRFSRPVQSVTATLF